MAAAGWFCLIGSVQAAEKSAKVVRVGMCWAEYNAVVVTMDNGDQLTLGDLSTELTKARLAT